MKEFKLAHLRMGKKGQVAKMATRAIDAIITIVVLFILYAALVPEAQSAGNDLNETGVPLGNLFVSDGFIFVLVMVGLLLVAIRVTLPSGKGGR